MLSAANKPIMLSVVMVSVVAHKQQQYGVFDNTHCAFNNCFKTS
jgi:hypothetical protein